MRSNQPPGSDHIARRAVAVVVAALLLILIAIWEPWGDGSSSPGRPTIPPGASGSLLPAITSAPGSAASPGGS